MQGVSLDQSTEPLQEHISRELNCQAKVYRAFRKEHVYLTLFSKEGEDKLHELIKEGGGCHQIKSLKEEEKYNLITFMSYD